MAHTVFVSLGDPLSDLKFVSWKEILLKTLDETDPEKLARLVPEAELAMFRRRQELDDSPENSEELSTMPVASEALRIVKRRIIKAAVLGPSPSPTARARHPKIQGVSSGDEEGLATRPDTPF